MVPGAGNDIFPEEFETFLLTDPDVRAQFRALHADLLDAAWWQSAKATLALGDLPEVLSYPDTARFAHGAPSGPATDASPRATRADLAC